MSSLPDHLPERLRLLGLRDVSRILTHTNRTVMVSIGSDGTFRIHRGYAWASDRVLRAIVRFLDPRLPRRRRREAQRELLAFPAEHYAPSAARPIHPDQARPDDVRALDRLRQTHAELNQRHFGGTLGELPIRLSGRMRTRLGELAVELRSGRPLEIAISRRHLARHEWSEVEHTMLHEMVHQWQAETGLRVDHGPTFRQKAREVGVLPAARRSVQRRVD
ncbi:MAG TPA: SprT-like domain-containing protein [Gemmatimonadales bacterium]|nr:SprT-like domain-containing protein [Gemmatimonadales bacterium]